jgi:hypothetical protein
MATGHRAFEGESQASLISAIMGKEPPPVTSLRPDLPPSLERLVSVCLEKDPDDRLQTAHDVMQEMKWIAEPPSAPQGGVGRRVAGRRALERAWRILPWTITAVATVLALAARLSRPGATPEPPLAGRFAITLPPGHVLATSSYRTLAVSPTGREAVFAVDRAGERLLLRRTLDSLDAVPVAGSEGGATMPFYSPDGAAIAFWLPGVGVVAVPTAGGATRAACRATAVGGGAWAPDGAIVLGGGPGHGLSRCAPDSVEPKPLTSLEGAGDVLAHTEPQVLPDGRILFVIEHVSTREEQRRVALLEPGAGVVRVLVRGATSPRFVPPRDLLFVRAGVLHAVTVDERTLVPLAPERRLTPGVTSFSTDAWPYWHARYDVSPRGPLVYEPDGGPAEAELAWLSRDGALVPVPTQHRHYASIALSPDASHVAAILETGAGPEIWVLDMDRGVWTRVSHGAGHRDPCWTDDGPRLLFASNRLGYWTVMAAAADGSGTPAPAGVPRNLHVVRSAPGSPASRWGLFFAAYTELGPRLFHLIAGQAEPRQLSSPGTIEFAPAVSPDGRWLAFLARDTGGLQLYVRDLPELKTRTRVSTEGATAPRWAADGRQLFYKAGDRIMAVSITSAKPFATSRPRVAAEIPGLVSFDVARDGRFLVVRRLSPAPPPQLVIVPDWRSLPAEVAAPGGVRPR